MEFEDGSFDGVLDKATLDSILVIIFLNFFSVVNHLQIMLRK